MGELSCEPVACRRVSRWLVLRLQCEFRVWAAGRRRLVNQWLVVA